MQDMRQHTVNSCLLPCPWKQSGKLRGATSVSSAAGNAPSTYAALAPTIAIDDFWNADTRLVAWEALGETASQAPGFAHTLALGLQRH